MFDVGFVELLVIGVVALVVLGPERLPGAARTVGALLRRARNSWQSVKGELEREFAAEDLKKTIGDGRRAFDIRGELRAGVDDLRRAVEAPTTPATPATPTSTARTPAQPASRPPHE